MSVTVTMSSLFQAGESLSIRCGAGKPTAGAGSAPQEVAKGAKLWLLPPQNTGTQIRPVLPDWYSVYHIPRCLHVRHPSGAKVRVHQNLKFCFYERHVALSRCSVSCQYLQILSAPQPVPWGPWVFFSIAENPLDSSSLIYIIHKCCCDDLA